MSFSTHSRILFSSEYFHYKIFIHEKKCLENYNDNFQENLSRPGIIDARARYRAAARRLRNTGLSYMLHFSLRSDRSFRSSILFSSRQNSGRLLWQRWWSGQNWLRSLRDARLSHDIPHSHSFPQH